MFRKNPPDPAALRQLALARLSESCGLAAAGALDLQQESHLLQELEIHQIELELQNEHLNTARVQLEHALNQSNELYDFSPIGNALLNADGEIAKLNLMAAEMLGGERSRLIGSQFALYLVASQRAPFNAMLAHARAEHEAQTSELMLQIDGQEPLPVQAKVVWIGALVGWQVALINVSERKRMEAQLRASEERLKLALSAVGDGVWDWQVSSGEVVVSDSYANLLGYTQSEMSNLVSENLVPVHPDDKPTLMRKLQDCITGKIDFYRNEQRMLRKDGSLIWVLSRGAVVLRSADGQAQRIIGTLVNITRNKAIEADLAAAAQFQQAVLDSTSAQIAVLDRAGKIVQTNAAWRNYASEFKFAKSVGQNYLSLLSEQFLLAPATVETVAAGMASVAAGKAPFFLVVEPLQCKCHRCWFTVKITPVNDAEHRLVVTHEDVSLLKQAELASAALANIDTLTGAFSRQHFMRLAEQELARSRRYALPLVVLMLDLDHFKRINDTYGHQAGDAVLQGFVQTTKSVLRESDVMGRIGGEEFAVLLPNTTPEGGSTLAMRIMAEIRAHPVQAKGRRIVYTVSMGAACMSGQASFGELLAECDTALYRAKNAGRDQLGLGWENPPLPSTDESLQNVAT